MTGFVQMVAAWALSFVFSVIAAAIFLRPGAGASGGLTEGLLGLGVLLGIPTLIFAIAIGWPVMARLSDLVPGRMLPVAAGAVLAVIMGVLTGLVLPQGWRGASLALIAYGAVLGLTWGGLKVLASSA